ncbi:hypothetical protein EDD65_1251, partial [Keratinibaculum paraultunense]
YSNDPSAISYDEIADEVITIKEKYAPPLRQNTDK